MCNKGPVIKYREGGEDGGETKSFNKIFRTPLYSYEIFMGPPSLILYF